MKKPNQPTNQTNKQTKRMQLSVLGLWSMLLDHYNSCAVNIYLFAAFYSNNIDVCVEIRAADVDDYICQVVTPARNPRKSLPRYTRERFRKLSKYSGAHLVGEYIA